MTIIVPKVAYLVGVQANPLFWGWVRGTLVEPNPASLPFRCTIGTDFIRPYILDLKIRSVWLGVQTMLTVIGAYAGAEQVMMPGMDYAGAKLRTLSGITPCGVIETSRISILLQLVTIMDFAKSRI